MEVLPATKPVKIFFTGTDTDVGKTFAAALVAEMYRHSGVRVGVYKPVASGCSLVDGTLIADDAAQLWDAAGRPRTLEDVCPQKFRAPLAPDIAARAEGKSVDPTLLCSGFACWNAGFDVVIIEGAGGLLSPLTDEVLNIDLVKQIAPDRLVIVTPNRLGSIHQVLATWTAAKHHGVSVDGLLLSLTNKAADDSVATNAKQIRQHADIPLIAEIGYGSRELCEEAKMCLLGWLNQP